MRRSPRRLSQQLHGARDCAGAHRTPRPATVPRERRGRKACCLLEGVARPVPPHRPSCPQSAGRAFDVPPGT